MKNAPRDLKGKSATTMATNGNSTHFFRIILPSALQNGTLELPRTFVKEFWKSFSMYARLKVPNGPESKIRLKMRNGRAWLDKGWPDFVNKHSITCGYFLIFKYEGDSRFSVLIFDLSTLEIQYPASARTSNRKVEKRKVVNVNEETDNAAEFRIERRSLDDARERVVERAMAFESRNPHFMVIMHPVYVSPKCHSLYVPKGPATSYFPGKENRHISFKVADGRAWPLKYSIGAPPQKAVTICMGWNIFARENHLREGDVCVFELVNSTEMAFKVTIFRMTDEQADKDDPIGTPDTASTRSPAGISGKDVASNATHRVLERPGSFKVYMSSRYVSHGDCVHIPNPHTRRYLRNQKNGENIIILHGSNGKTWPVKYKIFRNKMAAFKLGWKEFASDNNLRAGDLCVFEMITCKVREYKVTISRKES